MKALTQTEQQLAISLLKEILFESGMEHECDQQIHNFLESIGVDVSESYLNN